MEAARPTFSPAEGQQAALDALQTYWAAEEARDIDAILACLTPDAEFVDRFGRTRRGHSELRAFYEASAEAFPRASVQLVRLLGGPSPVAAQYEATLTDRAGVQRHARVIVVVHFRDNLLERLESYFDGAALTA